MGKLSKKERTKQTTRQQTQSSINLATKLSQYSMVRRTDQQVRDAFMDAPLEDKNEFSIGLMAERGEEDPLAREIGGQTAVGLIGNAGIGLRGVSDFTPADFRHIGGKPGFKLRGVSDYGAIERAFLACHNMPEETQEQIDAKKAAYFALQTMCSNWKDKHNLTQGGSGSRDEARKGNAVMSLFTHVEAKKRQLNYARRSAPSEHEVQARNWFDEEQTVKSNTRAAGSLEERTKTHNAKPENAENQIVNPATRIGNDHQQNMTALTNSMRGELRQIGTEPGTNRPIASTNQTRSSMYTYNMLRLAIGNEADQYIFNTAYPIAKQHVNQWLQLQQDEHNMEQENGNPVMPAARISACASEMLTAIMQNIPQNVLDAIVAVMRGMSGYKLLSGSTDTELDLGMFASDTLMLRVFLAPLSQTMRAVNVASGGSNDNSFQTPTVKSINIVNQSLQRLANGQTTHRDPVSGAVIRSLLNTYTTANQGFANLVRARMQQGG